MHKISKIPKITILVDFGIFRHFPEIYKFCKGKKISCRGRILKRSFLFFLLRTVTNFSKCRACPLSHPRGRNLLRELEDFCKIGEIYEIPPFTPRKPNLSRFFEIFRDFSIFLPRPKIRKNRKFFSKKIFFSFVWNINKLFLM